MLHRARIKGNFGHLMRRADSLEKNLMLGKTEGRRSREQQRTQSVLKSMSFITSTNTNLVESIITDMAFIN